MNVKTGKLIACKNCGSDNYSSLSRIKAGRGNFCSPLCYWHYMKGKPNGRKGMIFSAEIREKMSIGSKGKKSNEKNSQWKGDQVGYFALHNWVKRHLGKPLSCKMEDLTCKGKFEWANISRKYLRDLTDWMSLCKSHHYRYDRKGMVISN